MTEHRPLIAVVDDDERMRQALARLLRVTGYDVVTYPSAETFLADPAREHASFLIADIQLRGLSGLELTERLGRDPGSVPVAVITAHDDAEVRARAAAVGCVGFFRKPFPGEMLLAVIRTTLEQRAIGS